MKLSTGFWQTFKETPADAEIASHQLMLRAGLVHKSGSGLYNYLPFGLKAIQKVEKIVREEMNAAGGQELLMTMVTPGELWKESGRWDAMTEMCKFKDKRGSDVCLSPTNEEAMVEIFRKTIKSYKNLPLNLYQINTKFRDEIRPRFGLMRAREFIMKDAYTFHIDKVCLDKVYDRMYQAYQNVFDRMGLDYVVVEADAGAMAGSDEKTHEFQIIADTGEDELVLSASGYAANIEKAATIRKHLEFNMSGESIKEIETKDKSTIEDVCQFLKCPKHYSLKSLVYKSIKNEKKKSIETFYLLQLLGDDELNELKLSNYLRADQLFPATEQELEQLNLPKGYIGAYDLEADVTILFDQAIHLDAAYVVGAMKKDFHLKGFVPSRDIKEITQVDLRIAKLGDFDPEGKSEIEIKRGIEAGHIFQLGDKYTQSMNVTVLDNNGKAVNPLMGCYGAGITRIIAASIEQNFDDKGIVWPISIAPSHVHFVAITKSVELKAKAEEIYTKLRDANFEIIFDDRKAGPGFKFKDADLLGLPFQLVLGERDFNETGLLKIKRRKDGKEITVKPENLEQILSSMIDTQLLIEDKTAKEFNGEDPFNG
jgi:prolyl-tRNA synthetase